MLNDGKLSQDGERQAGEGSPEEPSQVIPALERDLEEFLVRSLQLIEPGLTLYQEEGRTGRQFEIEGGRIDLLCKDRGGDIVIIELKACEAGDSAVGQLLGYVGFASRRMFWGRAVRGVLIAPAFSERATHAAALAGLTLLRYRARFSLEELEP
jgi:RecB family endonuclease NucS